LQVYQDPETSATLALPPPSSTGGFVVHADEQNEDDGVAQTLLPPPAPQQDYRLRPPAFQLLQGEDGSSSPVASPTPPTRVLGRRSRSWES
jgi:hypothetical protein